MTSIVVNGSTPFGGMSNAIVDQLNLLNTEVTRLQAASANASTGYAGTAGTEYETGTNFGVVPSTTPGAQGQNWAYAVGQLAAAWATFWTTAEANVNALDNG